MSEARKHDAEKTRYDLVPADALEIVTQVWTFGASKYGDRNWRRASPGDVSSVRAVAICGLSGAARTLTRRRGCRTSRTLPARS